jgi:type IV secretion system protein VirB2
MQAITKKRLALAGAIAGYAIAASPTYAFQIQQLTSGLDWIKTTITGIGVVVMVIAIMWVGFKMMFQHAKWSEVAMIFFGGILIGGAAAIGPQLFGGGTAG